MYDIITILGPTASGKTTLSVALAKQLNAEIISADSRQVYRGMDIGTGKDLNEYSVENKQIPFHLIDIKNAGEKYNLYEFQEDFQQCYTQLQSKSKLVILCGGTGLYIEAVLKGYKLLQVPENKLLRTELATKSLEDLKEILSNYSNLANATDFDSVKRAIRAIEIAHYTEHSFPHKQQFKPLKSLIIGLDLNRDLRRQKISKRLITRLDEGLIDEVKSLLESGISADDLIYYGLEYKFVTLYLTGQLEYSAMVSQLEIAIHQFAKRQMTWFRGMERRGFHIHWLDADLATEIKIERILEIYNSETLLSSNS